MNRQVKRMGAFYKNLRECMANARKDCDTWYNIPKSRFNGGPDKRGELDYLKEPPAQTTLRNTFLGSFRDCFSRAWADSDNWYHVPKSQYQDPEFNRTAYSSPERAGILFRVGRFLGTFKHCISLSWEASDVFYHLPKSRYQNADFIKDLMKLSPRPKGRLMYRPFMIGRGVVLGEGTGKGWTVKPPEEKTDEVFIVPDPSLGAGGKPELEM